jgi:hypothetical protein
MTMYRDLRAGLDPRHSLAPAVRTNGTVNGTGVDLRAYSGALIAFHFGAYTDGTHTPAVQESDDDSAYTAVAAADLVGALTAVAAAGGANTTQRVSYLGGKRYVRAVMVTTGATSGAASAATVIRGKPAFAPIA